MAKKLSIIIPCFNEGGSIPLLKEKLETIKTKASFPLELIFIDDGSSDNTYQLLLENFKHDKVVQHETNLNLGAAVKTGIKHATGEYTAVIDSDCSYDPILLLEMYGLLNDQYDVIDASAHHPQAGFSNNTPWFRIFLSQSVVFMYNVLMKRNEFCYSSMFRIYKTPLLKSVQIENNNFLSMTELKIRLLKKNAKFLEIPAKNNFRQFGQSKMKIVNNIMEHLRFMLKILLGKV